MMKKTFTILTVFALLCSMFAGCAGTNTPADSATPGNTPAVNTNEITVVSREDGSGTRGAFTELFGIEEKDASGNKVDHTTTEALIAKATDVMLVQVTGNADAIGYVSLGSLNSSVKALKIDGAEPTADNIKNGSYKIARPFNIGTVGEPTGLAADFISYILSAEGQEVIEKNYIKIDDNAPAYAGTKPNGKIVIAGSSSVTPIMEKLKEAYVAINPNANIEIQMSDSSAGMQALADGTCDIGMASRELKDSEKEKVTAIKIALDGIAVVVNSENTVNELTSDMVKSIFVGETTTWDKVA